MIVCFFIVVLQGWGGSESHPRDLTGVEVRLHDVDLLAVATIEGEHHAAVAERLAGDVAADDALAGVEHLDEVLEAGALVGPEVDGAEVVHWMSPLVGSPRRGVAFPRSFPSIWNQPCPTEKSTA